MVVNVPLLVTGINGIGHVVLADRLLHTINAFYPKERRNTNFPNKLQFLIVSFQLRMCLTKYYQHTKGSKLGPLHC